MGQINKNSQSRSSNIMLINKFGGCVNADFLSMLTFQKHNKTCRRYDDIKEHNKTLVSVLVRKECYPVHVVLNSIGFRTVFFFEV